MLGRGDAVIYRSWRVDVVRSLCLPASWPCELISVIVGVTTIEEVVTESDEAMQSPWVVEPGEVGADPTAVVFVTTSARGCLGGREEFRDSLHMVSRQIRGNLSCI
jgi:hypothetical protein